MGAVGGVTERAERDVEEKIGKGVVRGSRVAGNAEEEEKLDAEENGVISADGRGEREGLDDTMRSITFCEMEGGEQWRGVGWGFLM